jgi:hypothetical protein
MHDIDFLPLVKPLFNSFQNHLHDSLHCEMIKKLLKKIYHAHFDQEDAQNQLFHSLPIAIELFCDAPQKKISFCALLKHRTDAFKFFFDMICCWLIPEQHLNAVLLYAADFCISEMDEKVYTLCEVMISVENIEELKRISEAFEATHAEICLGLESSHYARRILEAKGLSMDEKTSAIRKQVTYLVNRYPTIFDQELLTEMQLLFVMCPDQFKLNRQSRHLIRIICVHHLFRTSLSRLVWKAPQKRHLNLKIFRARIKTKLGFKIVLAISVGVNFFMDKEVFDKTHLQKAIQSYIPAAQVVENSYFANRRGVEHIGTLYLEIEKFNGEEFSNEDIDLLRRELPTDLKDRIEHLMHPVFMPRNEEEIIRNILSLSSQIKYVRDIPQVFISFDEQTPLHLYFIVILLRVLKNDSIPIQEMFKKADTFLEYIHDRTQSAGNLRRKYKKEATVFRVKLAKDHYLRTDHSIDLNRARQVIASELCQVIGEVRDYNGGIISKQNELFCDLSKMLKNSVKYNDLLLENFFYSLTPVILRSVLEPEALRTLFLMLLDSIEEGLFNGKDYAIRISMEKEFVFVMIKAEDRAVKEELSWAIGKLQLHASKLALAYVSVYDLIYVGYIYRCHDPLQQELFCETVRQALMN